MEAIAPGRGWPQKKRFPLSPFQLIALSMVVSFAAIILCASAAAQNNLPPINPFDAFSDIFPGQPEEAVEARGFFCVTNSYGASTDGSDEHCSLKLATGAVAEVRVIIAQAGIAQIEFTMRENEMRLGDLMLLWGQPEVSGSSFLMWRSRGIFVIARRHTGHPTPVVPVLKVVFSNTNLSYS